MSGPGPVRARRAPRWRLTAAALPAALLFLLAAGVAAGFSVMAARSAPADAPKTGPVTVRAVFPDGRPAAGAVVTIGRRKFAADGAGIAAAPGGIPAVAGVAAADTRRLEGGFLGLFKSPARYAAFAPVFPKVGAPLDVPLALARTPDMDVACRSCHPDKPTPEKSMVKCVHKSGVPVKPAQVARVEQFNKENDRLRAAGKAGWPAIVLEPRKKGFFGETRAYLVCESCHSNHVDTGEKAYVLMPFAEVSILCRGCHI